MSLLIKALEQAAKDRKTNSVEPTEAAAQSVPVEPTLEPPPTPRSVGRPETRRQPATSAVRAAAVPPPEATDPPRRAVSSLADLAKSDAQQQRARAAAVMQASGGTVQTVFAYLRGNPVMMLAAGGVLFGICFGVYVYLQISKPGLFVRQAAPPPPPPVAPVAAPAPTPQAAPTGLPEPAVPGPTAAAPTPGAPPAGSQTGSVGPPAAAVAPTAPTPIPSGSVIGSAPSADSREALRMRERSSEALRERAPEALRERGSITPPPSAEEPRAAPRARKSAPAAVAAAEPGAAGREGIKVSPTAAQPRLNPSLAQAYTLLQSGNTEEARSLYQRTVQAEPLNIDALLGLAYIAAQENRSDDALKLYLRILQLNPRHATAQAAMIGLMGRADPVASESRLKELIAREPSAFLHFILGNLYADQGQWAPAQQAYFQAHHLEPNNPDYAYNLAIGLDHLRQPKLALDYYRRADQLAAAQGRSNFNLSHARDRIRALSSQLE